MRRRTIRFPLAPRTSATAAWRMGCITLSVLAKNQLRVLRWLWPSVSAPLPRPMTARGALLTSWSIWLSTRLQSMRTTTSFGSLNRLELRSVLAKTRTLLQTKLCMRCWCPSTSLACWNRPWRYSPNSQGTFVSPQRTWRRNAGPSSKSGELGRPPRDEPRKPTGSLSLRIQCTLIVCPLALRPPFEVALRILCATFIPDVTFQNTWPL
mmetsp:Transcript_11358/g.31701  ORF Transcript_11358/g.31701 Transcript_11358/m.31701 type:complete len:209 (+) Transcript_11358:164-790(+)